MSESRAHGTRMWCSIWRLGCGGVLAVATGMLLYVGCASADRDVSPVAQVQQGSGKTDDFLVVDCSLPGQVRRLGAQATFLGPRQAVKTAARECEIRGGEYVAFDRANYATALKVWLPPAERGDPAAQTYVGEIFEKGLGVPPDYGAAAQWYRRAAESGYARAAINLGNLLEQGLGVPKDPAQALTWYRRAAGLSELNFEVVPSKTAAELQQARAQIAELTKQLQQKQTELDAAQGEVERLKRSLDERRSEADSERAVLENLRQELEGLHGRGQSATVRLAELQRSIADGEARLRAKDKELANLRESLAQAERISRDRETQRDIAKEKIPAVQPSPRPPAPVVRAGLRPKLSLGNYHALVIGNNNYRLLPPLRTAVNDAQEVARILKEQYRFNVTLLPNATRSDIMEALNILREKLTSKDNLLIYYAGHGFLDEKNQRGHWLPIDAAPNSTTNWIPNISVTDVLNAMQVRQLLLVADSCYSGTLTRSVTGQLKPGMTERDFLEAIQKMAQQRSRIVMTSGGVEPVLDSAGGAHSAFAGVFIQVLRDNTDGVLLARELFDQLQQRVAKVVRQAPEYAPIQYAGHEAGDFVFVRPAS